MKKMKKPGARIKFKKAQVLFVKKAAPKAVVKKLLVKKPAIAKKAPKMGVCIACGGTGVASKGGPCIPCQRRKETQKQGDQR